ncbi:hypothetical protein L2E82_34246 [Cichorium intybus]|uniref:Uncharacterized protein n=1 Tax=Cichorium intybus TaxID=13427 RepID=A0ACB9BLU3_CICIN|nr:hypothetical protein L2E82_34246 [Cichorium intybus]
MVSPLLPPDCIVHRTRHYYEKGKLNKIMDLADLKDAEYVKEFSKIALCGILNRASTSDIPPGISDSTGSDATIFEQGFMGWVNINPVSGLPSGFPELLQFVLNHVGDRNVEILLENLLYMCLDDFSEVQKGDLKRSDNLEEVGLPPSKKLVKKEFSGKFVVSADQFTSEMVRFML